MPSLDAIGIVVADLDRARSFYERLGLTFEGSEGHLEATTTAGLRVMLDSEELMRSFDPDWRPPDRSGRVTLAFGCGSTAEVDEIHASLVAAGARTVLAPWDAFWGQRYATVLDPDGNRIDLYAPLDG